MVITLRAIVLLLAFICFILTALNISAPRINLTGLGLALVVLAQLI